MFDSGFIKRLVAISAVLLLAAISGTNAIAQTQDTQPAAGELTFTLITGDRAIATVDDRGQLGAARLLGSDGEVVPTSIFQRGKNVYVIPASAQARIDRGELDLELFNLTHLYTAGYDDASSSVLPVIVEYRDIAQVSAVAGTEILDRFDMIDSAVIAIDKDHIETAWKTLSAQSGIETIWLDHVVTALRGPESDTTSPTVPLTGALQAHALGFDGTGINVAVLDTGYDFEHSDFSGQILAVESFVFGSEGDDLDGHGTHVAATIAGTGNESAGLYAGMAPGAQLLIGKVLSDTGSGSTSSILNGMLWAVSQGADVVNMSLGTPNAQACDGPMVDMVEALSSEALFVIAAGNAFLRETVSPPACAPSALAVAAVDRNNQTANFSSRGPSADGKSAKPDIASQGVDVISANAGGSGALAYQSLSGTSMASPHVAGGAALILQARPELTPALLKDVLTSSVLATNEHVLEQGAGPMDVARAIHQPVVGPANLSWGEFSFPHNAGVTTAQVPLSNLSDEDLSLKVRLDLIGDDGSTQLPATLAKLDVKTVQIPAMSSVDVPVTIDPATALREGAYGTITGRLVASSTGNSDIQVIVPVSLYLESPMVELTVNAIDRHGLPAQGPSNGYVINAEDQTVTRFGYSSGSATFSVPAGNYTIVTSILSRDAGSDNQGLVESVAMMAELGQKISEDTVITFDAADARALEFVADQPLSPQGYSIGYTYGLSDDGLLKTSGVELAPSYVNQVFGHSQGRDDRFDFFTTTRAFAPEPVLSTGAGTTIDYTIAALAPMFHGQGSAEVVFAGDGSSSAFEGLDVAGKIALVDLQFPNLFTPLRNAQNNGAVGLVVNFPGTVGRFRPNAHRATIPVITLTAETGAQLHDELAQGPLTLSWSGTAPERTPYAYSLAHRVAGRIDTGQVQIQDHKLALMEPAYHSQGDERFIWTDMFATLPGTAAFYTTGSPQMLAAPIQRQEYFSADPEVLWTNKVAAYFVNAGGVFDGPRAFAPGQRESTTWFKAPYGTTTNTTGTPVASRTTNLMALAVATYGDAAHHDGVGSRSHRDFRALSVYLDGERARSFGGRYLLPDADTEVRIEVDFSRLADFGTPPERLGVGYETVWTFTTNKDMQGPQPLLIPAIHVPTDMENTLPAGQGADIGIAAVMDSAGLVDIENVEVHYAYGTERRLFQVSDWNEATVENVDGQWTAHVPNDASAGEYVHLRVSAEHQGTTTVDQQMLRAYLLD